MAWLRVRDPARRINAIPMSALAQLERPRSLAREVDLAWSRHRGESVSRVPEPAQRATRNLKRSIEPSAKATSAAIAGGNWRAAASDYFFRTTQIGKARALKELRRTLAPANVEGFESSAIVRWLEPRGAALVANAHDLGFAQETIAAVGAALIRRGRSAIRPVGLVALEVPDHASGRLYQRSPGTDVATVIDEAARAFWRLDARQVVEIAWSRETLVLPAGSDGRFLCNVIFGRKTSGAWAFFARARTFITAYMAGPNQTPPPPAEDPGATVLAAMTGGASPLTSDELEALDNFMEDA
jgi:hypothetical protein